jgi:bifunctional DNA primase/polymerase-like protein
VHSATRTRVSQLRELIGPAVLLRWPLGSKGYPRKWKHLRMTDMTDAYLAKFERDCNIGVALGEVSNGLVSIDLDENGYVGCLLGANSLFATTLRTRASRGCNIWLRCNGSYPPSCKLKDLSGKEVGEWRADGSQTIVSGIHPDGLPYTFVVEKPVITVTYNQIIWPHSCLLPPDATESKRVRGVGEQEVVAIVPVEVSAALDCKNIGIQPWLDQTNRIAEVAPTACHQNNASLFKLARLVRSYENAVGRLATNRELEFVFDRWAEMSCQFWRPEFTRDDYYAEFLMAYSYARIGLRENPMELAVSRAKAAPLPEVSGFTSARIRLLVAICRELQEITGANAFYLPTRKLGDFLGAHWTQVAKWLRALEVLDVIRLAPGEVRKRGGNRSPRYHYRGPAQLDKY